MEPIVDAYVGALERASQVLSHPAVVLAEHTGLMKLLTNGLSADPFLLPLQLRFPEGSADGAPDRWMGPWNYR